MAAEIQERRKAMMEHVCTICGKMYKSRAGLSVHERQHTNKAPYKCCGKNFYSITHLQSHRCNKHSAAKKETCPECQTKFGTKFELEKHKKQTHMERPCKCDHCGQAYADNAKLKDHIDSHTGEKNHRCECGKSYRYSSGLAKHMRLCKIR